MNADLVLSGGGVLGIGHAGAVGEVFDRTDRRPSRWPTIGVTLIPQQPAAETRLVPPLRALRLFPSFRFLESVITAAVVGRDQGYLAQPWVRERLIEIDSLGVSPFDFSIGRDVVDRLDESGRRAAEAFVA